MIIIIKPDYITISLMIYYNLFASKLLYTNRVALMLAAYIIIMPERVSRTFEEERVK